MRKLATNVFFFVFVMFLVMLLEGAFMREHKEPDERPLEEGVTYGVKHVIDGDTVILYKGSKEETVRLVGIDAPETEHAPGGAECFNEESTAKARELLEGKEVVFKYDYAQAKRDAYDRLLGYIMLPDGTDFGAVMIEGGYAKEYTFKGVEYLRQSTYRQVEVLAAAEKVGLWNCE